MAENKLVSIAGPTATGKTALGISLARHFKTEIISADSRQFFREMSIGTAVPSAEELAAAPHHFIHHRSVEENYSVGDFEREALDKLKQIFQKKNIAIVVGGSGLYTDAVIKGLDEFPEVDPVHRQVLNDRLKIEGIEVLQKELKERDPDYFSEVDIQNPHRLIRALEICVGTGKPYSSFRKNRQKGRFFEPLQIGLSAEREIIYDRINRRVDRMLDEGLLQEAEALFSKRHLNALNTVGYKELFEYLEGNTSLESAVEEIKKNTRRFAKRQLTWLRKNKEIKWFDLATPHEAIIDFVERQVNSTRC